MKRRDCFAGRARAIIREIAADGREVAVQEIGDRMDLVFPKELRILRQAIADMTKRGELKKIRPGVYLNMGAPEKPFEKREIMWRVLRARRKAGKTATARYLAMQSGAKVEYAREWLAALARQEIVRRVTRDGVEGEYQLISDRVEMPGDDSKSDRLSNLRKLKNAIKRAQVASMETYQALIDAHMAVGDLEE